MVSILLHESVEDVPHLFRAWELRRQQEEARQIRPFRATAT
jgi:hypothetical protein